MMKEDINDKLQGQNISRKGLYSFLFVKPTSFVLHQEVLQSLSYRSSLEITSPLSFVKYRAIGNFINNKSFSFFL